jgi:hypothetical protein
MSVFAIGEPALDAMIPRPQYSDAGVKATGLGLPQP